MRKRTGIGLAWAVVTCAVASVGLAADPPPVEVGQKAPAFTLKDQNGVEQSLDALLKKGKVAIVFYRSADW